MPAMALSRAGARVVESGPGGQDLVAGAWQRLEALPDPRSRRGRIYPLACLVAVAVCAFTAAGNDRFTAVGQWIRRASQADLARLRAPWDPLAGRYRVPDEKTIRVVLNQLDRRALARALLGPRGRRRPGGERGSGSASSFCHVPAASSWLPPGPGWTMRAPTRDNAVAGMPHLVHADFRDLHDRVACPHPPTARFRPITHMPDKSG